MSQPLIPGPYIPPAPLPLEGGGGGDPMEQAVLQIAREVGIPPQYALAMNSVAGRQWRTPDDARKGLQQFKALYDRFGDWDTAAAAYHAGPEVAGAVQRQPHLWDQILPPETQQFLSDFVGAAGRELRRIGQGGGLPEIERAAGQILGTPIRPEFFAGRYGSGLTFGALPPPPPSPNIIEETAGQLASGAGMLMSPAVGWAGRLLPVPGILGSALRGAAISGAATVPSSLISQGRLPTAGEITGQAVSGAEQFALGHAAFGALLILARRLGIPVDQIIARFNQHKRGGASDNDAYRRTVREFIGPGAAPPPPPRPGERPSWMPDVEMPMVPERPQPLRNLPAVVQPEAARPRTYEEMREPLGAAPPEADYATNANRVQERIREVAQRRGVPEGQLARSFVQEARQTGRRLDDLVGEREQALGIQRGGEPPAAAEPVYEDVPEPEEEPEQLTTEQRIARIAKHPELQLAPGVFRRDFIEKELLGGAKIDEVTPEHLERVLSTLEQTYGFRRPTPRQRRAVRRPPPRPATEPWLVRPGFRPGPIPPGAITEPRPVEAEAQPTAEPTEPQPEQPQPQPVPQPGERPSWMPDVEMPMVPRQPELPTPPEPQRRLPPPAGPQPEQPQPPEPQVPAEKYPPDPQKFADLVRRVLAGESAAEENIGRILKVGRPRAAAYKRLLQRLGIVEYPTGRMKSQKPRLLVTPEEAEQITQRYLAGEQQPAPQPTEPTPTEPTPTEPTAQVGDMQQRWAAWADDHGVASVIKNRGTEILQDPDEAAYFGEMVDQNPDQGFVRLMRRAGGAELPEDQQAREAALERGQPAGETPEQQQAREAAEQQPGDLAGGVNTAEERVAIRKAMGRRAPTGFKDRYVDRNGIRTSMGALGAIPDGVDRVTDREGNVLWERPGAPPVEFGDNIGYKWEERPPHEEGIDGRSDYWRQKAETVQAALRQALQSGRRVFVDGAGARYPLDPTNPGSGDLVNLHDSLPESDEIGQMNTSYVQHILDDQGTVYYDHMNPPAAAPDSTPAEADAAQRFERMVKSHDGVLYATWQGKEYRMPDMGAKRAAGGQVFLRREPIKGKIEMQGRMPYQVFSVPVDQIESVRTHQGNVLWDRARGPGQEQSAPRGAGPGTPPNPLKVLQENIQKPPGPAHDQAEAIMQAGLNALEAEARAQYDPNVEGAQRLTTAISHFADAIAGDEFRPFNAMSTDDLRAILNNIVYKKGLFWTSEVSRGLPEGPVPTDPIALAAKATEEMPGMLTIPYESDYRTMQKDLARLAKEVESGERWIKKVAQMTPAERERIGNRGSEDLVRAHLARQELDAHIQRMDESRKTMELMRSSTVTFDPLPDIPGRLEVENVLKGTDDSARKAMQERLMDASMTLSQQMQRVYGMIPPTPDGSTKKLPGVRRGAAGAWLYQLGAKLIAVGRLERAMEERDVGEPGLRGFLRQMLRDALGGNVGFAAPGTTSLWDVMDAIADRVRPALRQLEKLPGVAWFRTASFGSDVLIADTGQVGQESVDTSLAHDLRVQDEYAEDDDIKRASVGSGVWPYSKIVERLGGAKTSGFTDDEWDHVWKVLQGRATPRDPRMQWATDRMRQMFERALRPLTQTLPHPVTGEEVARFYVPDIGTLQRPRDDPGRAKYVPFDMADNFVPQGYKRSLMAWGPPDIVFNKILELVRVKEPLLTPDQAREFANLHAIQMLRLRGLRFTVLAKPVIPIPDYLSEKPAYLTARAMQDAAHALAATTAPRLRAGPPGAYRGAGPLGPMEPKLEQNEDGGWGWTLRFPKIVEMRRRHLAEVTRWANARGQNQDEINKLIAERTGAAGLLFNHMESRTARDFLTELFGDEAGGLRNMFSQAMMSLSAIWKITQPLINAPVKYGVINTLQAISNVSQPGGIISRIDGGALMRNTYGNFLQQQTVLGRTSQWFFDVFGFRPTVEFSRAVASEAAKLEAQKHFARMLEADRAGRPELRGKLYPWTQRSDEIMKDLIGQDRLNRAIQRGQLDQDDLLYAGQTGSRIVEFMPGVRTMPPWWSTPLGRLQTLFHQFSFEQSRFIKNHVVGEMRRNGNLWPLMAFVPLWLGIGTAAVSVHNAITGNRRHPILADVWDHVVTNRPLSEHGAALLDHIIGDATGWAGLGLMGEVFKTTISGSPERQLETVAGPILGTAALTAGYAGHALGQQAEILAGRRPPERTDAADALIRQLLRFVPVIGGNLAQQVQTPHEHYLKVRQMALDAYDNEDAGAFASLQSQLIDMGKPLTGYELAQRRRRQMLTEEGMGPNLRPLPGEPGYQRRR